MNGYDPKMSIQKHCHLLIKPFNKNFIWNRKKKYINPLVIYTGHKMSASVFQWQKKMCGKYFNKVN